MATPDKPLEQMTAQERLKLGRSLYKDGKFDEAIAVWSKIRREEASSKTYADAQFNLGLAYKNQDELEEAITAWSNITRDDDPETYAQAQFNLGNTYDDWGKSEQAIETWSKVRHDDDPETYAWAQLNLGAAYAKSGELDEAITAWSKVRHDDDPETYARAQFNLGLAYKNQDKLKEAITAWSKIRPEAAGSETYAWAQLNLGLAYKSLGKLEQAITVLSKIRREEADPETYVEAQLGLGEVYSLDKEKEEKAHDAYDNVRDFSYYKSERGFKILNCPLEVRKDLHSLSKNTDEVLKSLQIIPEFESKVAHYSRSSTAFDLFKSKKNEQELSKFRLNTIRGVNDPTEGLVLSNYWDQQGIPETTHTNDTATFISCFTFNHDSLNQFRLYGKEDGREATGVSLVFKKEFFSKHSGALKYIAGASSDPSNNSGENESDEAGKLESDNKKKIISKSTLYRCIYLDPETGYWTLAQRDKSTFYRHYKEKAEKSGKHIIC